MGFTYLSNKPLAEAREEYIRHLQGKGLAPRAKLVASGKAKGRVTAKAAYARTNVPHYSAAAADGIAVEAAATFGAAASSPAMLEEGAFVPVDAGDPLPPGCDAVVTAGDFLAVPGGAQISKAATPWQHVRQIGEDISAGAMVVPSLVQVTPAMTGALLASGVMEVEVFARPKVGIIPTGSEVAAPSAKTKRGTTMESNSSIFAGMVEQWGGTPRVFPIVPGDPRLLAAAVKKALQKCDIVLVNGGTSAGSDDLTASVIEKVGEVFCHGIAIEPGRPAVLGNRGAKPILGIPGYPAAGIVVFEELLAPLLRLMGGLPEPEVLKLEATLSRRVESSLRSHEFVKVRLGEVGGLLVATALERCPTVLSPAVKADGILEIPQNSEGYDAGAKVEVVSYKNRSDLLNSLVVTGSHDPLIDELAELVRRQNPKASLASAHVGSMGAIMAAKRREMHFGGIHLLDTEDGSYNTSFVERYLPDGGYYLVECVQRVQGLMVPKKNPLGIGGIEDLVQSGLRYANLPKGSATRILFDHLCEQAGIDVSAIDGYGREGATAAAVAAMVAEGSADAGMGSYAAARSYKLGFVPVSLEQYDLLVPDYAWDLLLMQQVVKVLRSKAFRKRAEALGGYELDKPGTVRRYFERTAGGGQGAAAHGV